MRARLAVVVSLLCCGRSVVDELEPPPQTGNGLPHCIPGRVEACPCLGQSQPGVQQCNASGFFGACECQTGACQPGETFGCACPLGDIGTRACGSSTCTGCRTSSGMDASVPRDAGTPRDGGVVDQSVVLYAGTDTLVDLFPISGGMIVVRSTVLQLLDLQGNELAHVDSPREITAAAFDGTLLGVADRAILTVYSTSLAALRSTNLVETCASAVTVSGGRFVCGPANDWDRIYSVFDMNTGAMLRHGPEKYTYMGIPMRRVPGTDDFVTVTIGSSPSDFYLFRAASGPDAGVQAFGDSPYHGDFSATTVFAFNRSPATHLINSEGIILNIYTPACHPVTYYGQGCFARDGELGTLPNNRSYLAMTEVGDGTLYGITDRSTGYSYSDPSCKTLGCDVQRIDYDARVVRGSVGWVASVWRIVAIRWDAFQQRLVVGYLLPGATYNTNGGFRIVSFTP